MIDQVDYWIDLADDDVSTANLLLSGKKYLQAGFFCHLAVEKGLKAIIANNEPEPPPKTHDLTKLAQLGGILIGLSEEQLNLLDELTPLNIEARYPDYKASIAQIFTTEKTAGIFKETEAFLCWIKQKLGK